MTARYLKARSRMYPIMRTAAVMIYARILVGRSLVRIVCIQNRISPTKIMLLMQNIRLLRNALVSRLIRLHIPARSRNAMKSDEVLCCLRMLNIDLPDSSFLRPRFGPSLARYLRSCSVLFRSRYPLPFHHEPFEKSRRSVFVAKARMYFYINYSSQECG